MIPNEPEQLDREAFLMLYASGEMPAKERAEFEVQLASDPSLAEQLQGVREALARFEAALAELDARQRPPTSDAVAVRRAERGMQQWAVRRLRRPDKQLSATRRMPWWSYPVAAAAIIIVSFVIWSDRQPIQPTEPTLTAQSDYTDADAEALADRLDEEFQPRDSELAADDTQISGGEELGTFFINPAEVSTW